jgi:hypothetical protein
MTTRLSAKAYRAKLALLEANEKEASEFYCLASKAYEDEREALVKRNLPWSQAQEHRAAMTACIDACYAAFNRHFRARYDFVREQGKGRRAPKGA